MRISSCVVSLLHISLRTRGEHILLQDFPSIFQGGGDVPSIFQRGEVQLESQPPENASGFDGTVRVLYTFREYQTKTGKWKSKDDML